MPTSQQLEAGATPLTALSEEERFFQTTVRKFAREQIQPYVREMDEACVFRPDIIRQFFEMGLMGIEIPEEYGGQGGSFFQAVLAVEELSAVDPSAGVIVDVQNTICNNALMKWATPEQKAKYLPRLAENMVASYALSEAGSGSDAFAMAHAAPKITAITSCSPGASCGSPMRRRPDFSCSSQTPTRQPGTRASQPF